MEEKGITKESMCQNLDLSPDEFDELLEGKERITLGRARILARVLGGSVVFWMNRDLHYLQGLKR